MDIQRYQTTLDILHNGFIICAVLAVLFLIATVLLFWRFGMLTIIQQRFGIEAKRSREEFKEVNESTGALKYDSGALGERTPRDQLRPQDDPAMILAARAAALSGGLAGRSGGLATGVSSGKLKGGPPLTTRLYKKPTPAATAAVVAEAEAAMTGAAPGAVPGAGAVPVGAGAAQPNGAAVAAPPQSGGLVSGALPEDATPELLRLDGLEITRNVLLIHTSRDTLVP